jgi:2-polyprenyl-6-methoxyphenol hydroxylase-like FAD-dependent oxidoreductase
MTPTTPRIAIIGAGPVSLTLAAILTHNSIPFTIFEASTTLRDQGGSLDLHPNAGQLALKEAGLWTQFVKHARPEADVVKVVHLLTGDILFDSNGPDKQDIGATEEEQFAGRPEIDRGALNKITYESLHEGVVKWGKKLEKVVSSEGQGNKKHDLLFSDGTREKDFDLVVGGDGAWSKVRPLLTSVRPQYSGISMVELWHTDVRSNSWLFDCVGAGLFMMFGADRAVMAQQQGDGSLRTYGCLRVPEDYLATCGIDWKDTDKARVEFVERHFKDVAKDGQRVLLECKESLTLRALYELPTPFTFPHHEGVTLIGDAAHVMTPFAGVGVNVGMTDSLSLAREIIAACKGEKKLDDAVVAYEKEMFPRAEKNMRKTLGGKHNHFHENGSRMFANKCRGIEDEGN